MKKCLEFIKKETVLVCAAALAAVSVCIVPPDAEYWSYIDLRTIALLFCLMTVMAGLQRQGVFAAVARGLLARVGSLLGLVSVLVMLCFFSSMVITNDVALITFVPLTFTVFELLDIEGKKRRLVTLVVMETVAANLGSMLTPIGNPQNIYLYGLAGMTVGRFMLCMLPYALISLVLLLLWCGALCRGGNVRLALPDTAARETVSGRLLALYGAAFIVSILAVARLLPYWAAFAAVAAAVLIFDRRTLTAVDYSLLATFAAFFIFVGNMGRLPLFREFLQSLIYGREALTAVAVSQVISNVPAALLLSGFTPNVEALIVGTNIGGLGTLIASMASLISFKLIGRLDGKLRVRYLLVFTVANIVFLAFLLAYYAAFGR